MNERALAVHEEVDRRPLGDLRLEQQPRHGRPAAARPGHGTRRASRRRCASQWRSATAGWSPSVGTTWATRSSACVEIGPAADELLAAWDAYVAVGDEWSMSLLGGDLVPLAAAGGWAETAFELLGAADTMRGRVARPAAADRHRRARRSVGDLAGRRRGRRERGDRQRPPRHSEAIGELVREVGRRSRPWPTAGVAFSTESGGGRGASLHADDPGRAGRQRSARVRSHAYARLPTQHWP